ncbi:sulfite exporter TauE/SafE family protein [Roseimicrobium sp. ORNL1]|uniref:HoxN/HupN/NixA family nickel/cobalt transporter n=1 Tax=Roseimicrobium sp. ORNL1 TaxID=2711231 RepID=UPI001F0F8EFA
MNGGALLDTGHGWLEVCIHKTSESSRFRIFPCKASGQLVPLPKSTQLSVETVRLDGRTQQFRFEPDGSCWEATGELPEPHEFLAVITLGHADHAHTYRLQFSKDVSGSGDAPAVTEVREDDGVEYQDAHERAHAEDIARRFANRTVTTPQIVLFGITGGLMPCPAAFTVLLVCLQVKRVTLGFTLVAAFSLGLALTMVAVGVIAAWSLQKAHRKFSGLGEWMRRAPYISCAVLVLLALLMAWQGWQGLLHGSHHAHG